MSNNMAPMNPEIIDLTQLNMEEMIREYGEEEAVRLMNIIIENGKKMLKLQKEKKKKLNQRRRQEK